MDAPMQNDRNRILIESIKRLLRRGATSNLQKIVSKTHAADLSAVFRFLPPAHQAKLFDMIGDVEQKGIIFSELDFDTFRQLVGNTALAEMVDIFEHMPADDAADLITQLPEETASAILDRMKEQGSEEVESLLRYGDDTAGGIMVPAYIALREDTTAGSAIQSLWRDYLLV